MKILLIADMNIRLYMIILNGKMERYRSDSAGDSNLFICVFL